MENKKSSSPFDPDDLQSFLSEDDESGGTSGSSGAIEFKDFMAIPLSRDDQLPAHEINRLLVLHEDAHKQAVIKQKQILDERRALKEGKFLSSMQKNGPSVGSQFKSHPISQHAQFSGVDKQVNAIPSLNEANTNAENKDELQNRLQNRQQNVPKFNPRPRPPGG